MEDRHHSSVQETEDQLNSLFFKELHSKNGVIELLRNKKYLKVSAGNILTAKNQVLDVESRYKEKVSQARKSRI